jgi:hypothetical protein
MAVLECQNQVIFNMTVFDGEPRLLLVSKQQNVVFGILKASHLQYDAF